MKKTLTVLMLLGMVIGCSRDSFEEYEPTTIVPENLELNKAMGIKLQNYIVNKEVKMNVKLVEAGTYRLKIRDISGKLVSQEKLTAEEGDNILKTYTSSLASSSYTIELEDQAGVVLGKEVFAIQN